MQKSIKIALWIVSLFLYHMYILSATSLIAA